MAMTRRELAACELLFWEHVREGSTWTVASQAAGVDRAQSYRWRKANGFRTPALPRVTSGRHLSLEERLRIADLRLLGDGVRAIAAALGRSPSTISRELRRNSTRGGARRARKSSAGTDLSAHSVEHLQAVAAELNGRPRKTLGWATPAEAMNRLLSDPSQPVVATTL